MSRRLSLKKYMDQQLAAQRSQSQINWRSHDQIHLMLHRADEERAVSVKTLAEQHAVAHEREHILAADALNKATAALDRRMEGMNEFRQQLNDQASTFARQDYVAASMKNLQERFETADAALERQLEGLTARNAERIDVAEKTIVQLVPLGPSVARLEERIAAIEKAQFTLAGRTRGATNTIAWIFAGLAALGTIVTLLAFFLATAH